MNTINLIIIYWNEIAPIFQITYLNIFLIKIYQTLFSELLYFYSIFNAVSQINIWKINDYLWLLNDLILIIYKFTKKIIFLIINVEIINYNEKN